MMAQAERPGLYHWTATSFTFDAQIFTNFVIVFIIYTTTNSCHPTHAVLDNAALAGPV